MEGIAVKRSAGQVVLVGLICGLAACSPGQSSFEREAEKTINGDDGDKLSVDVHSADCQTPPSTDAETTFPCQAVDEFGTTYTFLARITGENKFEIVPN
jgi:hypothetical protein